jgi:sulfoxide reductase heme-binding subunit YedZ
MTLLPRKLLKPVVFILCLLPLLWLGWRGIGGQLGANPVEAVIRFLGDWALRFLFITLAMSTLRLLTGWSWPISLRRMLGLYAFFYLTLHLGAYVGLDRFFDFAAIWKDILRRNFITAGMIAFVLMVPLAVTSTNKMVKRLGGARWKQLHKLVYPITILGVLHYYWMAKADKTEPLIYTAILALLFFLRFAVKLRRRT